LGIAPESGRPAGESGQEPAALRVLALQPLERVTRQKRRSAGAHGRGVGAERPRRRAAPALEAIDPGGDHVRGSAAGDRETAPPARIRSDGGPADPFPRGRGGPPSAPRRPRIDRAAPAPPTTPSW